MCIWAEAEVSTTFLFVCINSLIVCPSILYHRSEARIKLYISLVIASTMMYSFDRKNARAERRTKAEQALLWAVYPGNRLRITSATCLGSSSRKEFSAIQLRD